VAGSATGGCGDFGVVLCAGPGGVCVGLREGRHLMPVCYREGRAPIYFAEGGGHLSCLELLLTRNADVNVKDK
jgi:hypothetical protein